MKKKLMILTVLVVLIFLVGSMGIYGKVDLGDYTEKGEEKPTEGGKSLIKVDDNVYLPQKELEGKLNAGSKCEEGKTNCWKIEENELSIEGTLETPFKSDVGITFNEKTKSYQFGDDLYTSNGQMKIDKKGDVYVLDNDGEYGTKITTVDVENIAAPPEVKNGQSVIHLDDKTVQVGKSNPIAEDAFNKYKSSIDWDNIQEGTNTIPLTNGGSLTSFTDPLIGATVTSVKFVVGDEETVKTTVVLPNGKIVTSTSDKMITDLTDLDYTKVEYGGEEATYDYGENQFTFDDGRTIAVEKRADGVITTTTEKSGEKTVETKDTKTGEIDKKEKGKDGKLDSWSGKDEKGNVVFKADIDGEGKVERASHYNENGALTGVGYFEGGDPEGEEMRIGITDTDNVYIDDDQNGKWDPGEKKYSEDDIDKVTNPELKKQLEGANWEAEKAAFWRGETDWQRAVGSVMSVRPGWHALSNLLAPEITQEWRRWADETFADAMLLDRLTVAAAEKFCPVHPKVAGESSVFIRTRAGTYQFVGSIQAEKTAEKTVILCSYEGDTCPKDYVCKESFCYEDEDAEEPVKGHFYKITWGVTAPQDEAFTPYIDENGIAIKFNLKFTEVNWWLYKGETGRGSENTIELKNGDSDGGVITHYSEEDFDEVCIRFGAPPKDWSGDEVPPICTSIETTDKGKIEFETSEETSSTTTKSGEVTANSDW